MNYIDPVNSIKTRSGRSCPISGLLPTLSPYDASLPMPLLRHVLTRKKRRKMTAKNRKGEKKAGGRQGMLEQIERGNGR